MKSLRLRPLRVEENPGLGAELIPLAALGLLLVALFTLGAGAQGEPRVAMEPQVRDAQRGEDQRGKAQGATAKEEGAAIVVGISSGGTVHLEGTRVELAALRQAFLRLRERTLAPGVLIAADEAAHASLVARVVGELKAAGAGDIGFTTRTEGTRHGR